MVEQTIVCLRVVQENRLLCPSEYPDRKVKESHSHFPRTSFNLCHRCEVQFTMYNGETEAFRPDLFYLEWPVD